MFYSIEGLHGVGKSTVAAALAQAIDAKLMPTIPTRYDAMRHGFNEHKYINARYLFFMAALAEAAVDIKYELQKGNRVVVESYFYRAIAFHSGMGATFSIKLPDDVAVPNSIYHLICDEKLRKQRILNRTKEHNIWEELAENRVTQILAAYSRHSMHIIDTTKHTPTQVVINITSHIQEGYSLENY